jgi:ABC-type uncharacterized transport system substrate-binding protein
LAIAFIASLSRPGGNLTGFIYVEAAMAGKWLALLMEIAPHVKRVASIFNPDTTFRPRIIFPTLIRGCCPIAEGGADNSAST